MTNEDHKLIAGAINKAYHAHDHLGDGDYVQGVREGVEFAANMIAIRLAGDSARTQGAEFDIARFRQDCGMEK